MPLEPLPQAAITAAWLRQKAAEFILQAEQLEAAAGMHHKYQSKEKVGYQFGKWGNEAKETGRKQPGRKD